MNKPLLYFSYLIIIANFLFFLIGFTNNIGIVGSYLGFLGAIGTDPIIIFMAIIIGAGLVVQQSRFSILYFILAAVVGAAAVHYFLGTKMFIIDVVRFDALLIMPALIVIVTSFLSPKSNDRAKKVYFKKVKAKHGSKVNKDFNKGLRSILIIITISVGTYLLVIPNSRESLVGENVTQYVLKPFFTSSRVLKCSWVGGMATWKCKTIDIEKWKATHNVPSNELKWYLNNKEMFLNETPLKEEVTKYDGSITFLENNINWNRERKTGTFYLEKKYNTNNRTINKIINILHPISLIILIFYTWRLRFCITGITVSLFKKIKAAI